MRKRHTYFKPNFEYEYRTECRICGNDTHSSTAYSSYSLNEKSAWNELEKDSLLYKICEWFASKNNERQKLIAQGKISTNSRHKEFVQIGNKDFDILQEILGKISFRQEQELLKYITRVEYVCVCDEKEWPCSNCGESERYCSCSDDGFSCSNCKDLREEIGEYDESCICDSEKRYENEDDQFWYDEKERYQLDNFCEIMDTVSKVYEAHGKIKLAIDEGYEDVEEERYGKLKLGIFEDLQVAEITVLLQDMEYNQEFEMFSWVGLKEPKEFWISSSDSDLNNRNGIENDLDEYVFPFPKEFYDNPKILKTSFDAVSSNLNDLRFQNLGDIRYDSKNFFKLEDDYLFLSVYVDGKCVVHTATSDESLHEMIGSTFDEEDADGPSIFEMLNKCLRPFSQPSDSFDLYCIDYFYQYNTNNRSSSKKVLLHVGLVFEDMVILICSKNFISAFKKEIAKDHGILFH